jgi:hypothetical protein
MVAWQFTARNAFKNDPSRKVRSELAMGLRLPTGSKAAFNRFDQTVPNGTVGLFNRSLGSKLPGYYQSVPPGQKGRPRMPLPHHGAGFTTVPTESASQARQRSTGATPSVSQARERSMSFYWEPPAVPTKIALSCEVTVVSRAYVELV